MERTSGKWAVTKGGGLLWIKVSDTPIDKLVAMVIGRKEAEANADIMVKAVNCHDALVETLKEVRARIASYEMNGRCLFCSLDTGNLTPVENYINAALAQVDAEK